MTTTAGNIRAAHALSLLADAARNKLRKKLGGDVLAELTDPAAVVTRAGRLGDRAFELLGVLLSIPPDDVDAGAFEAGALATLANAGFVYRVEAEDLPNVIIPVEIRAALFDAGMSESATLSAMLSSWDRADLEELAARHGADVSDGLDAWGLSSEIAEVMLDDETLDDLFESLSPATRRLVHWACDQVTAIGDAALGDASTRFAEFAQEAGATGDRVLERWGILHRLESAQDRLVIPVDLRAALRRLINTQAVDVTAALFESMRDEGLPGFRDAFPHGAGGNPWAAARRMITSGPAPEDDPLARCMVLVGALDERGRATPDTTRFLDVATPDQFAQAVLRAWLDEVDDPVTVGLLAPLCGDVAALGAAFGGAGEVAERWAAFVRQLRAVLLATISVLPPGTWFRLSSLARLFASIYRCEATWVAVLRESSLGLDAGALPLLPAEVSSDRDAAVADALGLLFSELLEPLGAVARDATGTLFNVNGEALRFSVDSEPSFEPLWGALTCVVGDDVDVWLPMPTHWGARVSGVAPMRWVSALELEVDAPCHVHDLLRLARWATPQPSASPARFVFSPATAAEADEDEKAELVAWLAVRGSAATPALCALLGGVGAAASDPGEIVRGLVDELTTWEGPAPFTVLEELRSWGSATAGAISADLSRLVQKRAWTADVLEPLIALAGELGDAELVAPLLRVIAHCAVDHVAGAATVALGRIGAAAYDGLRAILENPAIDIDRRLAAASALSTMAVLHPHLSNDIVGVLSNQIALSEDLPEDVPTLLAIFIAETGHPRAEEIVYSVQEQGMWIAEVAALDEVVWVASTAPCVWGHPEMAKPIHELFPHPQSAEPLPASRAGDDELPPPMRRRS